jgi:hypothetical protein
MSHDLPSTGPLEDIAMDRTRHRVCPRATTRPHQCFTSPVSKDIVAGGSAYPIGGGREVRPFAEVIKRALLSA